MGVAIRIGGLAVGSSGSRYWTRQFYILRSGPIWYRREINNTGGYFNLDYSEDSGATWDELMTLDLTEPSVVIDLAHIYHHRIVDYEYRVDNFLTALGYAGVEGVDWENLYITSGWGKQSFEEGDTFDNGKLVITFDDQYEGQYSSAFPLLQTKGVKATFYMAYGHFGTQGVTFMTTTNAQEIAAAGHDIECHTYHEVQLPDQTDGTIISELEDNSAAFAALGIPALKHMAYGAGKFNDHTTDVVFDYRDSGRRTGYTYSPSITRRSDKYALESVLLDNIDAAGMTAIKAQMTLAQNSKSALIVYGHKIVPDGDLTAMATQITNLEEIIDHATTLGMDKITHKQLHEQMMYIELKIRHTITTQNDIEWHNRATGTTLSIERSADGITYAEIYRAAVGETSYSDTELTAYSTYYYRARAYNGANALPYSKVTCMAQTLLVLTATGTGAGVSTLKLVTNDNITITLDGNGKFYTDAAGTLGESASLDVVRETAPTIYIKCTSGASNLKIPKNAVISITEWTSGTNACSLGGSISTMVACRQFAVIGTNTLSGNISRLLDLTSFYINGSGGIITGSISLLTKLTYLRRSCANDTLSGSITNLVLLTRLDLVGNTISGSVTGMTGLNYLSVTGSNTLSGNIANLTSLTFISVTGTNTLTGDIVLLTNLGYCSNGNTNTIIASRVNNLTKLFSFSISTLVTLTSANVNQILADMWANKDTTKAADWERVIKVTASVTTGAPTGQGLIDKAALAAYRSPNNNGAMPLWTVTTR